MMKNGQTLFEFCSVNIAWFLTYVWPVFTIPHVRVKEIVSLEKYFLYFYTNIFLTELLAIVTGMHFLENI